MRHPVSKHRSWRLVRGLIAACVLAGLFVGVPWALLGIAGNPIPDALPTVDQIRDTLMRQDVDGSLFLAAVIYVAWGGWITFALSVLVEIPAAIKGRPALRIPGFRLQQRAAAGLVGMVLLALGVGPTAMASEFPVTAAASTSAHTVVTATALAEDVTQEFAEERHTVQSGESLWRIAQSRLGDWARWPEIAELNYGVPQPGFPDGLDRTHVIHPGWVFTLPLVVEEEETPAAASEREIEEDVHQVRRGESLWRIAADDLGPDATNAQIAVEWPRWYEANRDVIGDDPHLIEPGMALSHPDAAQDPPPPDNEGPGDDPPDDDTSEIDGQSTGEADLHETDGAAADDSRGFVAGDEFILGQNLDLDASESDGGGDGEHDTAPDPISGADDALGDEGADIDDDQVLVDFPLRTAAGIGGLLAAGLLALLAVKRTRQRGRRRGGQAIPTPHDPAARVEQEMRNVADQFGVQVVDRALRTLAVAAGEAGTPLPEVRAARLTGDAFELYLTEPASLPSPWLGTADSTVWALPADVDTSTLLDTEAVRNIPAPYPSLVTIGHDTEGGHVLVDLEFVGALGITGPADIAQQVITALAAELASTSWADDLTVAVVGTCAELEDALGTGRLRHVDDLDTLLDVLEAHARVDRETLTDAGVSGAAQVRAGEGEWAPEIVLVATPLTSDQQRRLEALIHGVPRVAIAAVTSDGAPLTEWVLQLDTEQSGHAVLDPVGLPVEPQRMSPSDYAAVVDILRTGDQAPIPVDTEPSSPAGKHAWVDLDAQVASAAPGGWAFASDSAPAGDLAENDIDVDEGEAPQVMRPSVHRTVDALPDGRVITLATTRDGLLDAELEDAGPLIRVLGPVAIEHARGTVDTSHIGQLTEIAAYIALHPGAGSEDLDQAIWPGEPKKKASRAQACSRLRNWLGNDPDGQRYFPQMTDGHYRFHDAVRTDWDLFRALVPDDPDTVPTEHLEAALALVKGQPFTGATGRRPKYRWADRLKSDMITAVTDVAVVVADRALKSRQPRRARAAAATGLQAEPGMEQLWRYLLQAEHQAGNSDALKVAVERLHLQLEELGSDPEPETLTLLEELAPRHRAVAI